MTSPYFRFLFLRRCDWVAFISTKPLLALFSCSVIFWVFYSSKLLSVLHNTIYYIYIHAEPALYISYKIDPPFFIFLLFFTFMTTFISISLLISFFFSFDFFFNSQLYSRQLLFCAVFPVCVHVFSACAVLSMPYRPGSVCRCDYFNPVERNKGPRWIRLPFPAAHTHTNPPHPSILHRRNIPI